MATAVALAFLLLPILAIFLQVPPGQLLDGMTSPAAVDALRRHAEDDAVANALILLFGTPAAYLIATRRFRGRALLVTAGRAAARAAAGGRGDRAARRVRPRRAARRRRSSSLGLEIAFTQAAVVLAVMFVASPFYLRAAISAFEAVDPTLTGAARTLGAGPARTFFRVALPLAAGGLGGGLGARVRPRASASSARRSCSPARSRA